MFRKIVNAPNRTAAFCQEQSLQYLRCFPMWGPSGWRLKNRRENCRLMKRLTDSKIKKKQNLTSLFEKWGLDNQSIAPSIMGYSLGFFSYFLSRSWMASSNNSLRGLLVSTVKYSILLTTSLFWLFLIGKP